MPLSREAERTIAYILTHPEVPAQNTKLSWETLREILGADYPAIALRSMQRLGLLTEALPEFGAIDSLVVRDFYHRYTVDEHTLRTIEHLQELGDSDDALGKNFAPLWKSIERRDLLVFAMLLHDVGKGMPVENHVTGSLEALESAAKRLGLSPEEKTEVHFLIERHLEMSATMQRRDIFDPGTVTMFARMAGTLETIAGIDAADVRGYSRGESGGVDSVESGDVVAVVCGHCESLQPHAGPRPAARVDGSFVAGASAGANTQRKGRRNRALPGRLPATVSGGALRERRLRNILRCTRS